MLLRIVNRGLALAGLKLVSRQADSLYYQHDYGAGGMEEYRRAQITANKAKLERVWADPRTLGAVCADCERRGLQDGICHGARNGFEVDWLTRRLGGRVIGTDISDTASRFQGMVTHDFHERRDDWVRSFDFVYTNSLDQAFDPRKALDTWVDQLRPAGAIYVEHTMQHSAAGASAMDPFGAHPMAVPYLLFEWGKGRYRLADILHVEDVEKKGHVWIFVIVPDLE